MHFNPYGGVAAQIAVDLVNAAPAAPEALSALLQRHDYKPLHAVTTQEAAALNSWAARLRNVFELVDSQARVNLLNELLAASAARPYISQHDERDPHLHFSDERADVVRRVSAYTAAGLAHAFCEDSGRISACAREGCRTVFVDTSRNARRRFCSTRCANRVHVADHRLRALSV